MFDIVLMKSKSDKNHMSKETETLKETQGVLKESTSIINPVFRIEGNLSEFAYCNYVSVPTFGRYYFVNDITSIRNGIIELSCHVDVLTSFANEIKANTGIVRRQENKWNLYLNDGSFKVYQNPDVLTKEFPSGFSAQEFVLAIAGS
mgnify:FL=1